jgi:ABC-type lipoprotein release transport system permease subunit
MRSTLYGVGAIDLSVLLTVAVVLFFTALLASFLPARRASAIEPMQALRSQ